MDSPKCKGRVERVRQGEIEVERCIGCGGMFFDMLEADEPKKLAGSDWIDKGATALYEDLNKIEDYVCPKCETPMIRLVDKDQPHIWYEACSKCYGVFFDAGEFKDFKYETLWDRFKVLLSKERGLTRMPEPKELDEETALDRKADAVSR